MFSRIRLNKVEAGFNNPFWANRFTPNKQTTRKMTIVQS
jgi:hypothetical protein